MPGAVVHTIIAEHLPQRFDEHGYTGVADDALRTHRTALSYGSQGPDPFFLNLDDRLPMSVSDWMIKWMDFKSQIAYAFYRLKTPMNAAMESLRGMGNEFIDLAAKDSEVVQQISTLIVRIREVGRLASAIQKGFIKKTILDKADPFAFYISPTQTCGDRWSVLDREWRADKGLWDWFDTLHTRRTGDFITELLDVAHGVKDDGPRQDQLLSYAIGYLSHLAADLVGHAYVNSITGGPYRLHQSQRHTTQERIMDVWAYDYYYDNDDLPLDLKGLNDADPDRYYMDEELIESGFHKNFQFTDGRVDPRAWTQDKKEVFVRPPVAPINSLLKLPDEIAENFADAANAVFGDSAFGQLDPDEMDLSYRLWYQFTWGGTNTFGPVPPSELLGEEVSLSGGLKDAVDDFLADLTDIVDDLTRAFDQPLDFGVDCLEEAGVDTLDEDTLDCLEEAAESITNYVTNLARSVADSFRKALQLAAALWEVVGEVSLLVKGKALNYMLRRIYENLWDAYRNMLLLVTATGFGYMYSQDLQHPTLKNMYDPTAPDALNNSAGGRIVKPGLNETGFPRKGIKLGDSFTAEAHDILQGLENEGHLVVPVTEVEEPKTIPGPDIYGLRTPEVFISDPADEMPEAVGGDVDLPLLEWLPDPDANSRSLTSDGTRPVLQDLREEGIAKSRFTEPIFGDAVTLTVGLYEHYLEHGELPNLNMSGDRGFAYPTWSSAAGCECRDRDRWSAWYDGKVPWLRDIDPVFVPDFDFYDGLKEEIAEGKPVDPEDLWCMEECGGLEQPWKDRWCAEE